MLPLTAAAAGTGVLPTVAPTDRGMMSHPAEAAAAAAAPHRTTQGCCCLLAASRLSAPHARLPRCCW